MCLVEIDIFTTTYTNSYLYLRCQISIESYDKPPDFCQDVVLFFVLSQAVAPAHSSIDFSYWLKRFFEQCGYSMTIYYG